MRVRWVPRPVGSVRSASGPHLALSSLQPRDERAEYTGHCESNERVYLYRCTVLPRLVRSYGTGTVCIQYRTANLKTTHTFVGLPVEGKSTVLFEDAHARCMLVA